MTRKEFRHTVNNTWRINAAKISFIWSSGSRLDLRLTLEIFHNIEEPIVYVRLISKLDLDLIKITKRIL